MKLADVIDTGQLVAIKGHKTAIDTDSVALQPQLEIAIGTEIFDHVIKMTCEIVKIAYSKSTIEHAMPSV